MTSGRSAHVRMARLDSPRRSAFGTVCRRTAAVLGLSIGCTLACGSGPRLDPATIESGGIQAAPKSGARAAGATGDRQSPRVVRVSVGTEGVIEYRLPLSGGKPIQLRGVKSDRLVGATVWIDGVRTEGADALYNVRFIANIPGEFDLAGLLERVDGASTASLPPLLVSSWGALPEDHDGRLIELAHPESPALGGYRWWMVGVGVVWLTPVVAMLVRRAMRRRPAVQSAVAYEPSLADQLAPLVAAAIDGTGSPETHARLEMLLLAYWRDRTGPEVGQLEARAALAALRQREDSGPLLRAVETWLHAPPSAEHREAERAKAMALLEKFRHARAISPELLARRAAALAGAGGAVEQSVGQTTIEQGGAAA